MRPGRMRRGMLRTPRPVLRAADGDGAGDEGVADVKGCGGLHCAVPGHVDLQNLGWAGRV